MQLQELTALFGGYDAARYVHFFCMAAIVGFLVVHIAAGADRAEEPARHGDGTHEHAAHPQHHSRRRSEAADQGCGQAAARSDAAQCSCAAASLGALTVSDRLRHRRQRRRRRRAAQDLGIQRWRRRPSLFNPNTLAPTYPESAITRPFPFNAYYAEDEAPEVDGKTYKLEVGGLIDNKKPWTLDRALRAAAGVADHAPRLRRGLERDRLLAGRAAVGIPQAHRRRHPRQIRLVPVRRGLLQHHRHADRAASADPAHASSSTTRSCRASTASR